MRKATSVTRKRLYTGTYIRLALIRTLLCRTCRLELQPGSHKSLVCQPSLAFGLLGDFSRQLFLSICNQKVINSILYPAGKLFSLPSMEGRIAASASLLAL